MRGAILCGALRQSVFGHVMRRQLLVLGHWLWKALRGVNGLRVLMVLRVLLGFILLVCILHVL